MRGSEPSLVRAFRGSAVHFQRPEIAPHVALRRKVIEFVWSETIDQIQNPFGAGEVAVMQEKLHAGIVWVLIDVIDREVLNVLPVG